MLLMSMTSNNDLLLSFFVYSIDFLITIENNNILMMERQDEANDQAHTPT